MLKTDTKKEHTRTLRDYLETVFRHKNKAILFFLAVVISSVIVLKLTPGSYTSTSTLMIRRGRENVVLDPTTATGAMLPIYKDWASEINSELEILKSHELVENVIMRLGPTVFLTDPKPDRGGKLSLIRSALNPARQWIANVLKRFQKPENENGDGELGQRNKAVRAMEKNLHIHVQENSDIITVSYTATRPELAKQVVTLLIDSYFEKRIDVRKTPGAYQFFTDQREQLLDELQQTEKAIRTIKEEADILSLEDSRLTLQSALQETRTRQLSARSSLAAANARVNTLRTLLSQQSSADPSLQNGGALLDREERKELQAELRREETAQSALSAENLEISRQLTQLRAELAALDKVEPSIRSLQREQDLLEEKYRKYSENQEQARINQALETEKISNVSIVQHATLPTQPDPSRKMFKLLAAMCLGLAGAIGIAFGADYLDPTLHSAADISERLHLTTLIELPDLPAHELDPCALPPEDIPRETSGRTAKDCFQELCFKILALRTDEKPVPVVIGITSTSTGEGVSTIAANLAAAFSRDDRFSSLLLLDANPEQLPVEWGEHTPPFTYQHINDLAEDDESEPEPPGTAAFAEYLAKLKKQQHDIIVVDIPPVSEGGYAVRAAAELDIVILAVEAGRVPWRTLLRTAGLLRAAQASLGGIILNRQRFAMPAWLYRKL